MHKILGTRLVLDEEGMVYVHYHLLIDESADMEYNDPYSWSHLYVRTNPVKIDLHKATISQTMLIAWQTLRTGLG